VADGTAAIERNRQALQRILLGLVAMSGFGKRQSETNPETEGGLPVPDCRLPIADCRFLPRRVHRAILRLLRPAEAAARRLIIAMARGLVVPPSLLATDRRHEPQADRIPAWRHSSPVHGGGVAAGDGGGLLAPLRLALPLFDSLSAPRRHRPPSSTVPRISLPGHTEPFPIKPRLPPMPGDPLCARRLLGRLDALARALGDMPRQAMRFARWQSRRRLPRPPGSIRRLWPLRTGRPPGSRMRGRHEVYEVLAHAHALAFCALEHPNTS